MKLLSQDYKYQMPLVFKTIDKYIRRKKKKSTYCMVFNKVYNEAHFLEKMPYEDINSYKKKNYTDNVAREEFLQFMKGRFPNEKAHHQLRSCSRHARIPVRRMQRRQDRDLRGRFDRRLRFRGSFRSRLRRLRDRLLRGPSRYRASHQG